MLLSESKTQGRIEMTPHEFFYFMFGLFIGIGLMGMLAGLVIIWKDRPKRNYDIGTPEEQYRRFEDYHAEQADLKEDDMCKGCPLKNEPDCRIAWMNMPYKKEEQQ